MYPTESSKSITLTKVQSVETFFQSSAVRFFQIFDVIRQPLALDSNVLQHAAVARYSLLDIPVTFPLDSCFELTPDDGLFDQRSRVVVELAVAAESHGEMEDEDA